MHKLLKRQLKRFNIDPQHFEDNANDDWKALLNAVGVAYTQSDQGIFLSERSLGLVSQELVTRNRQLKEQLSELESAQTRLEDSLSTLNTTFDSIGEAILAYNEKGELIKWNRVAARLLGLNEDINRDSTQQHQSLGRQSLFHLYRKVKDPSPLKYKLRHISEEPRCELFGIIEFKNGEIYEYHSSAKLKDNNVLGRVWCLRDITYIKKNEALIQHQAFHDALTGLPNRALFLDRLNHAITYAEREGRSIAVLFIDLDNFKQVNDTCGHHQGDLLLKQVAERINLCLRDHDTLARLGGDEFTVILEGACSNARVTKVSKRILGALKNLFLIEKYQFHVTCSIGISMFPCDSQDRDELIRKADMAMYHAKEQGRNNFQYFNSALEHLAVHHIEIESQLRQAIQNNELCLYYQPKIEAQSGEIIGVEALLRWFPPNKEPIPPGEFIGIAEQSGLINQIGAWVFEQACQQINRWQKLGIDHITVAVNLSTKELQNKNLVNRIRNIINKYNTPTHLLIIEITETVLMEDLKYARKVLHEIRQLNISLAIDDFGTGYSSMQYLQQLPIDCLKIDKSFVLGLSENKQNEAIVSSMITLGHNLGLSVVAEGVEEKSVLDYLKKEKCDQIQGFYCYRPLDVDAVTLLLKGTRS